MLVFEFILADPLFPEELILVDVQVESLNEDVYEFADAEPPCCEDNAVQEDDPFKLT